MNTCARVCTCACVCVRACMRDVFAIYDNNILPSLIMIIIKINFLYFVEIAHTDDFPSKGTRLVYYKSPYVCRNSCSIVSGDVSLFVSTEGPSTHEFAFQFGLAIFCSRSMSSNCVMLVTCSGVTFQRSIHFLGTTLSTSTYSPVCHCSRCSSFVASTATGTVASPNTSESASVTTSPMSDLVSTFVLFVSRSTEISLFDS